MSLSRYNYRLDIGKNIVKDTEQLANQYKSYMLTRTNKMFKYSNLPDTIPQKDLEFLLQVNGSVTITEVNGKLYAFNGALGGRLNEYYLPTLSVVANPYLEFNKVLKINEDCIVGLNDSLYIGLMPLFSRYATLVAHVDNSIYWGTINSRVQAILSASDDNTFNSLKEVLAQIENGSGLGVVSNNALLDSLKSIQYTGGNAENLKTLIELKQYLLSNWYIELGLSANYNMKRESLNENEINADEDILLPLCDDMLDQRKLMCELVNKKYNTNISVDFNSSWKKIRETIEIKEDILQNEVIENEPIEETPKEEKEEQEND